MTITRFTIYDRLRFMSITMCRFCCSSPKEKKNEIWYFSHKWNWKWIQNCQFLTFFYIFAKKSHATKWFKLLTEAKIFNFVFISRKVRIVLWKMECFEQFEQFFILNSPVKLIFSIEIRNFVISSQSFISVHSISFI